MKTHRTLLSLLLLAHFTAGAQNREVVISRGFHNFYDAIDTLPGNRWVFAGVSSPAQGAIYKDTIHIWVSDSTGRPTMNITVHPPRAFENFKVEALVGLPDSSILILYSGGDCDAGGYEHNIERYHADGSFAWRIPMVEYYGPMVFTSIAGNKLLMMNGEKVSQIDVVTGEVLWEELYTTGNVSGGFFIPGTADLIISDNHMLKYYRLDTTGSVQYQLVNSKPYEGYLKGYTTSGNGIIYASHGEQRKIVRFGFDLEVKTVKVYDDVLRDFVSTPGGVIGLFDDSDTRFELRLIDTVGNEMLLFANSNLQIVAWSMDISSRGIGLLGWYVAGYLYIDEQYSTQAWFRYLPMDSLHESQDMHSVAITRINQQTTILADSVYINDLAFMGYLHDFAGGDFEIEVKNTGDQPVDSFWINARFGNAWFIWFCGLDMCKEVFYRTHLEPGESVWVEFGDIYAINQINHPDQYCFWTSGPNSRPDHNPSDDWQCAERIVSTASPALSKFTLFPQPASTEVRIPSIYSSEETAMISIYSVDGRLSLQENSLATEGLHTLNVSTIPNGFYIVRIGNKTTPLIIHRDR